MVDELVESFEHKSKEKQGNLVCKTGAMLCFVVVIMVGLVIVIDYLWTPYRQDLIADWTPELITITVFLVGFVAGWIVREATRN